MAIRVSCPECKKELSAPDELIGRTVACPRCKNRFTAEDGPEVAAGTTTTVADMYPPGSAAAPPTQTPPTQAKPARAKSFLQGGSAEAPANAPSTANNPPIAVATPVPPNAPPVATSSTSPPPVQSPASVPVAKPVTPDAAPTNPSLEPPIAPAKPKPVKRAAQAAKFIAADPNEARIQLGADGQLPQLVLVKDKKDDAEAHVESSSSPLVLAIVLSVSLGMTMLMLFVDFDLGPTNSFRKREARGQIEEHYIGQPPDGQDPAPNHQLKEYQRLLRKALQAHNRGDFKSERRLYRTVLNLLHAEGKGKLMGVTGMIGAKSPPNDEHLEEQLSMLLD